MNFNEVIQQTIREFSQQIIRLNQSQLEDEGINSEGISLPPYAAKTVAVKKRKGQRTDHMTLKDTGRFHNSFYVLAFMKFFEQGAKDRKTDMLEKRYDNIFGLTEANLNKLLWDMGLVERLKENYLMRVNAI